MSSLHIPHPMFPPTRYNTKQLQVWFEELHVIWFELQRDLETNHPDKEILDTKDGQRVCALIKTIYDTLDNRGYAWWCINQYEAIQEDVLS